VAAIVGRDLGKLNVEDNVALAASYIASAVGYLIMGVLAFVGTSISDSGGGSFVADFGDLILPLIVAAIVVGVAGVVSTYLELNY